MTGGEHYHKVVKHLEIIEEPDNLQTRTLLPRVPGYDL